jgi:hypothetical protein
MLDIQLIPSGESASGASIDWKLVTVPNIMVGTNHLLPPSISVTCCDLGDEINDEFTFHEITNSLIFFLNF